MPKVFYFGRWGRSGHQLWTPDCDWADRRELPYELQSIDGIFCGDPRLCDRPDRWPNDIEHQPEGQARLHHLGGWTVLAFWDRSADLRFGANSAFLAEGTHTAQQMVELAEQTFPRVWARITGAFRVTLPAA